MRKLNVAALAVAIILAAPFAFSQDVRNTYILVAAQVADGILTNAKLVSMATSTVKCRTTAGTGVPEDCTAAQAAAIVGSVGGALKSKLIQATYDLTTASGAVAYTGFGFTPSACITSGAVGGALVNVTFTGLVDSSGVNKNISAANSTTHSITTSVFRINDATGTNNQVAVWTSYDADGLTLTWTKTGTPTGTAVLEFLCFR